MSGSAGVPYLDRLEAVAALRPDPARGFLSAEHAEIAAGHTSDIYFVRTLEMLRGRGLDATPAAAEVFAGREGVLAGLPDVLSLLRGRRVRVWTLDEGERFAAGEVVLRVEGPYGEFGPLETALLGCLASASGWASAAARCRQAAGDRPVLCFGARHVHPAVAPAMERSAVVGGASGASCILGAKLAGLEPSGTMPHAAVLLLGDTVEAALAYDAAMPPEVPRVVLVDTFRDEAEESLRVAAALGPALQGVRLDTPQERGGVTAALVREVRARLDQAGFGRVRILVSGGLGPERIAALAEAGADGFGVGSYISSAAPIDMTMDLKEIDGRPVAKRGRIPGLTGSDRLHERRV